MRVPSKAHSALRMVFRGLTIATEGELTGPPGQSIDHIAHTSDLTMTSSEIRIWPKKTADGMFPSDHFGVWADFESSQDG